MNDPAFPDALPAQYRLHWYVLENVLGQGGFGITYLARDTNLDQAVAIKEYLPIDVATRRADCTVRSRTDDQQERYRWGLDRFIQEARTLARFDHPNIVRALSVFEHNNTAYMVMRFEEGENLGSLLERRRTLPEAEIRAVLLPILDGLALVHGAGFIHRDIKPENIHIRSDGTPVLLDFGSARNALGQARTVTILVAPGYAPFEQYYANGQNQGPWTDIYGLGATCYRAIAGTAPMDAIARSKGVLGSTREILKSARELGAGRYSERFLNAVDHALEFSEKDRPQSVVDWRAELLGDASRMAPVEPAGATGVAAVAAESGAGGRYSPLLWGAMGAMVAVSGMLWYENSQLKTRTAVRDAVVSLPLPVATSVEKAPAPSVEKAAPAPDVSIVAMGQAQPVTEPKPSVAVPSPAVKPSPETRKSADPRTAAKPVLLPPVPGTSTKAEVKPTPPAPNAATENALRPAEPVSSTAGTSTTVTAGPVTAPPPQAEPKAPEPRQPVVESPRPPADPKAAFEYWKSRAASGDAEAYFRTGEMYATGLGVEKIDNKNAYIRYAMAARAGYAGARAKQDEVAKKLQPAEIRAADDYIEKIGRAKK